MRRAAVAVFIGGLAFWGIGSRLGHQPAIVDARLTAAVKPASAAEAAEPAKAAGPATQTVTFGGYTVSVPASWPVYDLTKNPRQCVRYDVNAVYLGTPGPDQDCPPNLVGRVDTVTIQAPAAPAGAKSGNKGPLQAGQKGPAPGTIVQDPDLHELALAMPDQAPSIGATYGTGPGAAEQMLASVRRAATKQAGPERAGDSIRITRNPVVVQAAGNDGPDNSATNPPGQDPTPGIVMVASYDDHGTGTRDGSVSSFSSRGAAGHPETWPDISAPGSNITSSCRPYLPICSTGLDPRNGPGATDIGTFNTISGTSMATPHVTAVLALVRDLHPEWTYRQVIDQVLRTVDPVPGLQGKTASGGYEIDLPIASIARGEYVFEVAASHGADQAKSLLSFRVN